ncbi:MAG: hypothetical protein DWQ07_25035 [Chloroflexi bacterium]|nr:MAG: hypothetical protein DWQ07_25035 [Chloroflexota bacterium]MBL1196200.1 hypothetical protein [Chloroflexota bacterium]NOH13493.1 hypothetical protein [Chloroflexota bacterium]
MLNNFDGLIWVLLTLTALLFLQRRLHRETQVVFLILTRRGEIAMILFSLVFFPGVVLHEASHYIMAKLLGVPTGRISILPRDKGDGRLQLGFVETGQTDIIRDSLIGAAPFIFGALFVAYAAHFQLGLTAVWEPLVVGNNPAFYETLAALPGRSDFWLWVYLTVAVSSTMLPSASDRRAWLPLFASLGALLLLALLVGAGSWMLSNLAPAFNSAMRALALVLGVGVLLHLLVLPPLWLVRRALSNLTGLQPA